MWSGKSNQVAHKEKYNKLLLLNSLKRLSLFVKDRMYGVVGFQSTNRLQQYYNKNFNYKWTDCLSDLHNQVTGPVVPV